MYIRVFLHFLCLIWLCYSPWGVANTDTRFVNSTDSSRLAIIHRGDIMITMGILLG